MRTIVILYFSERNHAITGIPEQASGFLYQVPPVGADRANPLFSQIDGCYSVVKVHRDRKYFHTILESLRGPCFPVNRQRFLAVFVLYDCGQIANVTGPKFAEKIGHSCGDLPLEITAPLESSELSTLG